MSPVPERHGGSRSGRRAALDALLAVEKGRVQRLGQALALGGMGRREVGLARELAAGVERNRGFLDFLLSGLARRDIDLGVLAVLLLVAFVSWRYFRRRGPSSTHP